MDEDIRTAARRWAHTWQEAWPAHAEAKILALYAPAARFEPHPFRPSVPVATYLHEVFQDEVAAVSFFDEPIVDGNRAAVHWRARTQLRNGREENLTGVSLLVFNAEGLVAEHRDFWVDGAAA